MYGLSYTTKAVTPDRVVVYEGMENEVDISTLTMEQYIALISDDIKLGIVNPKIGDDVEFEINANFMRELRHKLFAGTDDEDAYEHVRMKLEEIRNFKKERDETLYHAWERYNDLLYQCPLHNLNSQQKYDEATTGEGINDVLDNVDTIHESFKGEHLTKEYPLKKEDEGIKSLQEDGDNLIDFCLISNLEVMLMEFLVLN
ncbi:hypothetical protein Tco_1030829 [Tanacetum coccineum]|uniref:Uncharacterized protein n=1 Tax=Tanacetum coccineum TaxID=301880 RepID=A0ABQ5G8X7_9ASTR